MGGSHGESRGNAAVSADAAAMGEQLRDVFSDARNDPAEGLAEALVGVTGAAGAVTGLGERGLTQLRDGGEQLIHQVGPAAAAVQSAGIQLRDNSPDWDDMRSAVSASLTDVATDVREKAGSGLATTADTLRDKASVAREAAGPVSAAAKQRAAVLAAVAAERAAELASTGKAIAVEQGEVARKKAAKAQKAAKKSAIKKAKKSATVQQGRALRKDLEARIADAGERTGEIGGRVAGLASTATALATAKLTEKERKARSRRRRRRVLVVLLGAAVGAAVAVRMRQRAAAAAEPTASAFGASGPGTAAGAPVDLVDDADKARESTAGATTLPPATDANAAGDLKT